MTSIRNWKLHQQTRVESNLIKLSDNDFEILMDCILNPKEPNQELIDLMKKTKEEYENNKII